MAALDNQLIYFPISTIKYRQHFNQVTINKKQSMISNLFIINHTSTQMHELRCKFISEQTSLPDYIKLYAKSQDIIIKFHNKFIDTKSRKL